MHNQLQVRGPNASVQWGRGSGCTQQSFKRLCLTVPARTRESKRTPTLQKLKFHPELTSVLRHQTIKTREMDLPRKLTLTHNDFPYEIFVNVTPDIPAEANQNDAVLARWLDCRGNDFKATNAINSARLLAATNPLLRKVWRLAMPLWSSRQKLDSSHFVFHIHCSVPGRRWRVKCPLWQRLRSFIFQQKIDLAIEAFTHAESDLLAANPTLRLAPVWVHLDSNVPDIDRKFCLGPLITAAAVANALAWGIPVAERDSFLRGLATAVAPYQEYQGLCTPLPCKSLRESLGLDPITTPLLREAPTKYAKLPQRAGAKFVVKTKALPRATKAARELKVKVNLSQKTVKALLEGPDRLKPAKVLV